MNQNKAAAIANLLDSQTADSLMTMSAAIKEVIISTAINLPADKVQTEMLKEDMSFAKKGSDLIDEMVTILQS